MKFKKIPDEYFLTILDRLTRFEPACIRYKRVFDDILTKFYFDNISKNSLTTIDKINIVQEIIANTINYCNNEDINKRLLSLEEKYFTNNNESKLYLNSKINYKKICEIIQNNKNLTINSKFFIEMIKCSDFEQISKLRNEKSLLFPIEKIVLCEGQTEYLLLKSIFKILEINFDKIGIFPIQAGGKSKVVKKYYEMLEYCKLPFFILLDKDGVEFRDLILSKLRSKDKLYIISCGEFEDLIPIDILQNVVNYIHKNELLCNRNDFNFSGSMVENLKEIYRKYGFGEFKKAHFALEVNEYIKNYAQKTDFQNSEILKIASSI